MQRALQTRITQFQSAQRWRRSVERELRDLQLTLTQWLVLDALQAIHLETDTAVSQLQVGHRLDLDKATISDVMVRLGMRGLVDRAPAYPTPELRIYPTEEGQQLLEQGRALIEAVSARFEGAV